MRECTLARNNINAVTAKKSFTAKSNLVRHERVHTGEKSYQCSCSCGSHLVSHEIIHTDEQSYQCSHCGKKIVHRSSLYTSEKLSLCRLKAVKYYLLAYQYIFIPPNPPTYFWRIFLESQPWIDHNSIAYMRRVSNDDTHLEETISMHLMLQRFLRNGDLPGI